LKYKSFTIDDLRIELYEMEKLKLEREWKDSLRENTRIKDKEIALVGLKNQLEIYQHRKPLIEAIVQRNLKRLYQRKIKNPDELWFWEEVIFQLYGGEELVKITRDIKKIQYRIKTYGKEGLISEEEIRRAKVVDPERFVAGLGLDKLKIRGSRIDACCPFHSDKTPSFNISRKNGGENFYFCHGCGKGGDLINLIMELKISSFKEAVRFLLGS